MQHPSERSVDEILKAIQKVIEKDARENAAEAEAGSKDGVLLNDGTSTSREVENIELLVSSTDEVGEDDAGVLDLGAAGSLVEEGQPETPAKPKIPPERIIAQIEETLTSDRAAEAMRRSLSNLSRVSDAPPASPIPTGETTIEQLVREMLRPMLAQWLDANLPPMVEKLVKDEISRIAGKRG